jgi:uncharacterized protein (DUF362 family)
MIMKRRQFIRSGFGAFLASFLPLRFLPLSGKAVTVYEITGDPALAFSELFTAMGGIGNQIGNDLSKASVLVKPNLCLPHKDSNGTITSIAVLRALCEYLINEGVGRIIIADHTLQTSDKFETTEIVAYARGNPKISLMLADEQRYYAPRQIEGKVLKTAETMKIVDKVDYFINLATAKHHSATHVSLCIKNLMGIIWDRKVFHTDIDLDQAIADLAVAVRPHLNIVDASRVLLNRGPVGPGPLEKPGKIYASTDILAVDAVVTSCYNFGGKSLSAKEVAHLWESFKNGAGEIDLDTIEVVKRTV